MSDGGRAERETCITEIACRLFLLQHVDAWYALAAARLQLPEEAIFRLYAREEWQHWPILQKATVAGMAPCWYADQAAADAMARILWRRAPVSQDARARTLGVRSMDYRRATRQAEALLRSWLHGAALAYLAALTQRDGFTPRDGHTETVELARPPTRPRAAPRHGQLPIKRAA